MGIHRFIFRACAATVTVALLAASIVTAAQTSSQTTEKSATGSGSQDPFQSAADKATAESSDKAAEKKKTEPEFIRKTNAQWRKILPRYVYMVTREKATEPAFSGKYPADRHYRGVFVCACCDAADAYSPLFNAQHKFDSGTGWPSFWRPFSEKSVVSAIDNSNPGEQRIEVMCRRCGAHLGHVFDDNPAAPTGLRFCINSLAIKLKAPEDVTTKTTSANSRTKAKSNTRTTLKTKAKTAPKTTQNSGTSKTTEPDPQDPVEEKSSDAEPASPKD
jgi:peptide-methionine (R)-S-oxide reductase